MVWWFVCNSSHGLSVHDFLWYLRLSSIKKCLLTYLYLLICTACIWDAESAFFVGLRHRVKVEHRLLNLRDCDSVLSERCRQTNSQDFFKNNNNMGLLFLQQVKAGTAYAESLFSRTSTPHPHMLLYACKQSIFYKRQSVLQCLIDLTSGHVIRR